MGEEYHPSLLAMLVKYILVYNVMMTVISLNFKPFIIPVVLDFYDKSRYLLAIGFIKHCYPN